MPKKIFAVTNIKIGNGEGEFFAADTVIDRAKFTDKQLLELHEAGAIEIRVVDEEVAPDGNAITDVVSKDPTEPPVEPSQTVQTNPSPTTETEAQVKGTEGITQGKDSDKK